MNPNLSLETTARLGIAATLIAGTLALLSPAADAQDFRAQVEVTNALNVQRTDYTSGAATRNSDIFRISSPFVGDLVRLTFDGRLELDADLQVSPAMLLPPSMLALGEVAGYLPIRVSAVEHVVLPVYRFSLKPVSVPLPQ